MEGGLPVYHVEKPVHSLAPLTFCMVMFLDFLWEIYSIFLKSRKFHEKSWGYVRGGGGRGQRLMAILHRASVNEYSVSESVYGNLFARTQPTGTVRTRGQDTETCLSAFFPEFHSHTRTALLNRLIPVYKTF